MVFFAVAESHNIGDSASRYPCSGMKTAESLPAQAGSAERFCRGEKTLCGKEN